MTLVWLGAVCVPGMLKLAPLCRVPAVSKETTGVRANLTRQGV